MDEDQTPRGKLRKFASSWLVSLAAHSVLLLLLALFSVAIRPVAGELSILLTAPDADGSDGGSGGALGEVSLVSEPTASGEENIWQGPVVEAVPELAIDPVENGIGVAMPIGANAAPELGPAAASGVGDDLESLTNRLGDGDSDGLGRGNGKGKLFGVEAYGKSFVYVFDRSESMKYAYYYVSEGTTTFGSTALDAAKNELINSINGLEDDQKFHVIFYNHAFDLLKTRRSHKRPMPASDDNKTWAMQIVRELHAEGSTEHVSPLEVAIRMKPDVIFLITDGEEKDDPSFQQVEALTRINRGKTSINVIQYATVNRPQCTLIELARRNRGRHTFIDITRLGGLALKAAAVSAPPPQQ
jgi:hypothetical protein